MDILIDHLHKHYGKTIALNDVNVAVAPGIHGLLGPNGAGKTTLLRILTCILDYDSGEITWGKDYHWKRPKNIKRRLGYLPQHFGMYKSLRVEEALRGVALLKDIPRQREKEQIDLALERANLSAFRRQKVGKLSGGMLRRLGIAQAFLGEPDLLIMDEPTVGLDPEERIYFRKILREYATGERIVLLSSHIVADIESLCDDVTILYRGRVLANGPTIQVQSLAEGKVGERIVCEEEMRRIEKEHSIIHFSRRPEGFRVRYLSEDFTPAQAVTPSLEDSYTYIVKGGKSNEEAVSGADV